MNRRIAISFDYFFPSVFSYQLEQKESWKATKRGLFLSETAGYEEKVLGI